MALQVGRLLRSARRGRRKTFEWFLRTSRRVSEILKFKVLKTSESTTQAFNETERENGLFTKAASKLINDK